MKEIVSLSKRIPKSGQITRSDAIILHVLFWQMKTKLSDMVTKAERYELNIKQKRDNTQIDIESECDFSPNPATQGTPRMYSTNSAGTAGTVISMAPTPSAVLAYSVDFIAPETGLSAANPATWIDTNASTVLLAAALYEASAFLKAPETLSLYKTQFDEAVQLTVQEMQRDYAAEYNGGI